MYSSYHHNDTIKPLQWRYCHVLYRNTEVPEKWKFNYKFNYFTVAVVDDDVAAVTISVSTELSIRMLIIICYVQTIIRYIPTLLYLAELGRSLNQRTGRLNIPIEVLRALRSVNGRKAVGSI